MQLYTFHRSSASYRVRIALNLKGLTYDCVPVHLSRNGGEQNAEPFQDINPQSLVPVLVDEHSGTHLTQSLAILEYLETVYPDPALLPADEQARAQVRSFALSIACDIHPLNNLRVLKYLTGVLGVTEEQKNTWYRHWAESGLGALETALVRSGKSGKFCFGDSPTIADCCLVPQLYNARRFDCRLDHVPTLVRIGDACMELEAFRAASPERQSDAA